MLQAFSLHFIKKRLQHRRFPVTVVKFFRTPIFTEHLPAAASDFYKVKSFLCTGILEIFSHLEVLFWSGINMNFLTLAHFLHLQQIKKTLEPLFYMLSGGYRKRQVVRDVSRLAFIYSTE